MRTERAPSGGFHGPAGSAAEVGAEQVAALAASAISMSFNGVKALDSLDLVVRPGEVRALLGENGSGKSTFIKILSGYHTPDAGGHATIAGSPLHFGNSDKSYALGCRVVHQDLGLIDELSILDNLCMSSGFPRRLGTIRDRDARRSAGEDLARVGIRMDPRTPVARLQPALKTGVAVARALRQDNAAAVHLLILDEPTATLPDSEVARLHEIVHNVANSGVGIIYVTHRLEEVFTICDNVTILRNGRKAADRPTRGLTRGNLVNLLVGREFDEIHKSSVTVGEKASHTPRVLEVSNLVAGQLRGLSFQASAGEIVGVAGIVGSGRESLLGSIFGAVPRQSGHVRVAGTGVPANRPDKAIERGLAYLPPDRKTAGGLMELTARENLTLADLAPFWRGWRISSKQELAEAHRWMDRLAVRPQARTELPLRGFSGGNQQRILFGKWLRRAPSVFLLDEPTQGVDIGAKAHLHRQLIASAAAGMTVVVSSADVDELFALCHRVIVLRDGQIAAIENQADTSPAQIAAECLGPQLDVMSR
jgi:ribose transport system ATP-binding protein